MMKEHRKYLLLFFLILSLPGFSQVDALSISRNNKFILSVSAGISIPLGNFSFYSTQDYYSNTLSGSPKIGFCGKLDVRYLFPKHHFGITMTLLSSINKSWSEYEGAYYRRPTTGMGGGTIVTSHTYETKNWYFNSVLAGLFIEPMDNSQFLLRFWLAGGILQSICPETKINQTGYFWRIGHPNTPFNKTITQPQMFSYKMALNTGSDFSICLTSNIRVTMSIGFLASDAAFYGDITTYYDQDPNQKYNSETTITNRVYFLYCNFGLEYKFN